MSPLLIGFLVSSVVGLAGYFLRRNSRTKKVGEAIEQWAPIIYDVVNNMVAQDPNIYKTKPALFEQRFTEVMKARGIEVTPAILTQAQAIADSLHYQDKRQQAQVKDLAQPLTPLVGQVQESGVETYTYPSVPISKGE